MKCTIPLSQVDAYRSKIDQNGLMMKLPLYVTLELRAEKPVDGTTASLKSCHFCMLLGERRCNMEKLETMKFTI